MGKKPARQQVNQPVQAEDGTPLTIRSDGGGALGSIIDRAARLQAPAVAKYVASVRKNNPDASPAEVIDRLGRRYLLAVTGSGGAVGATAAVPGVGTIAAFGAIGVDSVLFMEASALYALAIAEVYGIPIDDRELRRALVLTAVLGDAGLGALRATVGTKNATLLNLKKNPAQIPGLGKLNKQLMGMFTRRFLAKRAPLMLGKLLPAGAGAVVGAGGNRALGKAVVKNAREAFGPVPVAWSGPNLRIVDGSVHDASSRSLPE